MTSDDPKQRLLSVYVGEVSLVDHPANEVEFLVMKAMEQSGLTGQEALGKLDELIAKSAMADAEKGALRTFLAAKYTTAEATMADTNTKVEKAELDPYTAMTVTLNAARDRLWSVSDKLREDKLADASKEMEGIKTMIDAATEHAQNITKAITEFTDGLKAVIAKGGDGKDGKKKLPPWMKANVKKLAEMLKEMEVEDEEEGTPTTKSADSDADVIIRKDGAVVLKGGKQFSKDRLAKLKDAVGTLVGTLKEADPDGYNDFVSAFAPTPGHVAAVAQATGNAAATTTAPTTKAADAEPPQWAKDLMATVTKSTEALNTVTARVEAVEKSGAIPKALGTDSTEGKPVEKAKGFWTGVL